MILTDMFLVIAASVLFGVMPGLTKYVQLMGVSSDCVVLWTYCSSFLFYILMAIIKKQSPKDILTVLNLSKGILTGAVGMGYTTYFLNLSYSYIPTGMTTLLHFSYPVMVIIFMAVFFHEPITGVKKIAGLLSILGMLFVTGFTFSSSLPGILTALLSALCYSFYLIMGEKSSYAELPVYPRMAAMAFGASLVICIQMMFRRSSAVPASPLPCIGLITIGLISSIAFVLMTKGVRAVGSSKASFASMLEPVTSVFCGTLFFREPFRFSAFIGLILILASMRVSSNLPDYRYSFR